MGTKMQMDLSLLKHEPCVYILWADGRPVAIGKTVNAWRNVRRAVRESPSVDSFSARFAGDLDMYYQKLCGMWPTLAVAAGKRAEANEVVIRQDLLDMIKHMD